MALDGFGTNSHPQAHADVTVAEKYCKEHQSKWCACMESIRRRELDSQLSFIHQHMKGWLASRRGQFVAVFRERAYFGLTFEEAYEAAVDDGASGVVLVRELTEHEEIPQLPFLTLGAPRADI